MQKIAEHVVDILLEELDDKTEFSRGREWAKKDKQPGGWDRDLAHYPKHFAKGYRAAQRGGIRDRMSNAWDRIKGAVGAGRDMFGLGSNTEPGWKPNYGPAGTTYTSKPRLRSRPPETGPKTWDITP